MSAGWPTLDLPEHAVGVEIESEGISRWDKLPRLLWATKRDASLRGDNQLECVTYPLAGSALLYALHTYCENATQFNEPFSWRCSTHIHLNLLDMEPPEVASLLLLTFAADNYFYAAGSEARRENYNCRPLSLLWPVAELCGNTARHFQRGNAKKGVETLQPPPGQIANRYVGMNWHSLPEHGTLEIRHFPGSRDLHQLVRWTNLGAKLLSAAQSKTISQIHALVQQGPERFGSTVFGDLWAGLKYAGHENDWHECLEGIEYFMTCFRHSTESPQSLDGVLRRRQVIQ